MQRMGLHNWFLLVFLVCTRHSWLSLILSDSSIVVRDNELARWGEAALQRGSIGRLIG